MSLSPGWVLYKGMHSASSPGFLSTFYLPARDGKPCRSSESLRDLDIIVCLQGCLILLVPQRPHNQQSHDACRLHELESSKNDPLQVEVQNEKQKREPVPKPVRAGTAQSSSSPTTGFLLDCQPDAQQPGSQGHLHGDQKSQVSVMGSDKMTTGSPAFKITTAPCNPTSSSSSEWHEEGT